MHSAAKRDGLQWLLVAQGIDEFVYVRKPPHESLFGMMKLYEEIGSHAVYVPWLMFGSKVPREMLRGTSDRSSHLAPSAGLPICCTT